MKSTLRINTLFALAMLALVACQKEEAPASTPAPAMQNSKATEDKTSDALRLADAAGNVLVTFRPRETEVTLGTGDRAIKLQGRTNADGKRKYSRPGAGMLLEVKPGDDGFKLRNPESHLLWKVKLKDDSIKVSNNEENAKPVVLKIKNNCIEVSDNDTALGEVRFDAASSRASVYDATGKEIWSAQAKKISAAFGLHLATRIPETERAVLELELLARDL